MTPAEKPVAARPAGTLGLSLLVALVVGSAIGSGIFGLPQNMAAGVGAGAILISWAITGIGMLMLAFVYQMLALRKPELDNGMYAYARALSGEYAGFNSAWGYWISAWIGNVSYLVAAFGALGYFYPAFGAGNSLTAIIGASVVVWIVHALVLRGIQGAAALNAVVTIAKVAPLLLFIVLVVMAFQIDTFTLNFWGDPKLGSVLNQVKSTMLVTVWVFIGIEGASVYSARARKRADVGRATVIGFLVTLALLMAVSLLSLGIFAQPDLAALKNPSMAGVLEKAVGTWGAVLIYIGLIISVGGGLLARELAADCLVIATNVAAVFLDWGQPDQRAIHKVTPQALAGQKFPEGSMRPKVDAACAFVLATGKKAFIGSLDQIEDMLAGRAGTEVCLEADGGANIRGKE